VKREAASRAAPGSRVEDDVEADAQRAVACRHLRPGDVGPRVSVALPQWRLCANSSGNLTLDTGRAEEDMATLKDLSSMTSELDRLGGELHAELTEGDIDFRKMVALADQITENAEKLADAFDSMGSALETTLDGERAESDADDDGESDPEDDASE